MKWLGNGKTMSKEKLDEDLRMSDADWNLDIKKLEYISWAITCNGEVVGMVRIRYDFTPNLSKKSKNWNLRIYVGREHQKKGIATEIMKEHILPKIAELRSDIKSILA